MPIYTVRGPIEPDLLGITSMHEHVFIDGSVWYAAPDDAGRDAVTMDNLGWLRRNIHKSRDNLRLDDPQTAVAELLAFKEAGGGTLVDLTPTGMGRRTETLRAVAQQADVNIVVSTGLYVHDAHPAWLDDADVDAITNFLIHELRTGIDGSTILPALVGEIGTSAEITDREWRVIRASGRAGSATGAAVNVHLDPFGTNALAILDVLLDEDMPADRVIFSHLDEHLDRQYHLDIAESGAILEYDTFGAEFYWGDFHRDASDRERLNALHDLISLGYAGQLVLGCDVWIKICLQHYGGLGYAHLPKTILPLLRRIFAVGVEEVDQMVRRTPARLLERPALDALDFSKG